LTARWDGSVAARFNGIARRIKEVDWHWQKILLSMQLAPQGVVSLVYPLVNAEDLSDGNFLDNSGAIGCDNPKNKKTQRPSARCLSV
jgi:hypothetical protein